MKKKREDSAKKRIEDYRRRRGGSEKEGRRRAAIRFMGTAGVRPRKKLAERLMHIREAIESEDEKDKQLRNPLFFFLLLARCTVSKRANEKLVQSSATRGSVLSLSRDQRSRSFSFPCAPFLVLVAINLKLLRCPFHVSPRLAPRTTEAQKPSPVPFCNEPLYICDPRACSNY